MWWVLIALVFGAALMLVSWRIEEPHHLVDKQSGEPVKFKRNWASIYINGTCHKGMMTIEFRETYLRIYQTFSHRIVLRTKYSDLTSIERERPWLESFETRTAVGEKIRFGLYKRDVNELKEIVANQELEPTRTTPVELGND